MKDLNPFYLLYKRIIPELVLMVRLLAIYLIISNESPFLGNQGGGRFLPIIGFLEDLGTDWQYNMAVHIMYYVGILILLFSSFVRTGCLLAGLSFIIGTISCQTCISVAHLFVACVFVCTALSNRETGSALIRYQLIVLYLGADLNKAFDMDWWNGASMETLLAVKHQIPAYLTLAGIFPPMLLSQMVGISVIVLQFGIAIALLKRNWLVYAMIMGAMLHLPMVLLMHMTFGPFVMALVLAYSSLLHWPKQLRYQADIHSSFLVKLLKILDFNDQVMILNSETSPGSFKRWFRTFIDFLTHPAILLSIVVLSAGLIRYGFYVLLVIVVLFIFYIKVWKNRSRIEQSGPGPLLFQ
ncbi:MAG: hypothetical protein ABIN80_14090 [Dyadobacter sp.]|uniref:hypothetical protein n=1 Tax=Dyadobacter sp. TaxID=1914288 RepID=UPI0032637C2A